MVRFFFIGNLLIRIVRRLRNVRDALIRDRLIIISLLAQHKAVRNKT